MKSENQLPIAAVDQKLPIGKNLMLAIQHMFVAILAAIPVPLMIASSAGLTLQETSFLINAVIFTAGVSSILASIDIIKGMSPKVPMMMGAAFAVASVCISTLNGATSHAEGFRLIAGSTIVAGAMCFLIAPLWSKLRKFFPPLVVGIDIMLIGIALIPNTFHWMMDQNAYNQMASIDPRNLLLAAFVCVVHILLSKYLKGFLSNLSILFSLIIGTIVSIFFNFMDFSQVQEAAWFGFNFPFHYGAPKFELSSIITYLIITILLMVEISGTAMGIHEMVDKEVTDQQLTRVFRSNGLSTMLSGAFNSVNSTAFVQNMSLIDLSKTSSRFVTATAGIGLILVSFFPKVAAIINSIPKPVLGGVGFAMFGVIIASGVNMLKKIDLSGNNLLIIALSIGMSMIPAVYPNFYGYLPNIAQNILGNGIIAGALTAIVLNVLFNFSDVFGKNKHN